jgi:peptidoglycan-N-acetylglucosamine deacetylase
MERIGAAAWQAGAQDLAGVLGIVVSVDVDGPLAALTFDDDPHPDSTPRVLDVLQRHGARATFFLVGRAARRHPELVERIVAGGHAIGHHTLDHVSLPGLDWRAIRERGMVP